MHNAQTHGGGGILMTCKLLFVISALNLTPKADHFNREAKANRVRIHISAVLPGDWRIVEFRRRVYVSVVPQKISDAVRRSSQAAGQPLGQRAADLRHSVSAAVALPAGRRLRRLPRTDLGRPGCGGERRRGSSGRCGGRSLSGLL